MKSGYRITLSLLAAASLIFAQDTTQSGWKKVGETGSGQAPALQSNAQPAVDPPADPPAPPQLTLKAGTFITVRLNQVLSSDRNQPNDAFTGTLVGPLVVDGFVVAQPGQTMAGRVVEAKKAGQAKGVSHLGIQLTNLTFVDGQQASIQSDLVTRTGPTSVGRDATAIGVTTGAGAAIGAGAGALASTIGVLLTRGKPTIIGPESVLTFKIDADVNIATDRSPQAFRLVGPNDYNSQPTLQAGRPGGYAPAPGGAYYAGGGYPYGYPYGYGYPFYGPGVGLYFGGPGFFGPRIGFRGRFR